MNDFEYELESELHRVLDPLATDRVPARRTVRSRATRTRAIVGGAGAALTFKVLTGVMGAAAAVTVAGVATTGTFDPGVWGVVVTQAVTDCKADLTDGQHGIGDCVSDIAKTHGQAVASAARQHGEGSVGGSSDAHGNNSSANDHAKDKTKDHPSAPAGRPTDQPDDDDGAHATSH
jgi:hypothetical protein